MKKIVTTWETNEKLSLKTRERYLHLETNYLREKQRNQIIESGPTVCDKDYVLFEKDLYLLIEIEIINNNFLISKNGLFQIIDGSEYIKKPNSKIWRKEN